MNYPNRSLRGKKAILILCCAFALGAANAQQTQTFNYSGSITSWTIPSCVTQITINAVGSGGGYNSCYGAPGGYGASMQGTFTVTPGQILQILAGQEGQNNSSRGGGGGGSFVALGANYATAIPLIVAGGGGGGGYQYNSYANATLTTTGNQGGGCGEYGTSGTNGGGGGGGNAGAGGGGGGFYGNGGTGTVDCNCGNPGTGGNDANGGNGTGQDLYAYGGYAFVNGGATIYPYSNDGAYGGFGGGGSSYAWNCGGGGGGGYSGGGGGGYDYVCSGEQCCGGGGGSYNAGTNQSNSAGYESGNGYVTIYYQTSVLVVGNILHNVSCYDGSDGMASAIITGSSPYTYSWSPSNETMDTATGLSAGSYTVTVYDACSDMATASVTITQPTLLNATASVVSGVSCNGGANGETFAGVSGGIIPYTYSWSGGGGTNFTATGLSSGTYSVQITDKNGCTATASAAVTQPTMLVASPIAVNVTCNGGSDGIAASVTSGGISPYTYSWVNGQTTDTIAGLSAGTYTLGVTDANGCTTSDAINITQPNIFSAVSALVKNQVSCNGGNNGTAWALMNGGGFPFTYSWSNGGTSDTAGGLTMGSYTVTVNDACGASATASVTITQPTVLNVTAATVANVTCNGNTNGSASSSPSGGTSPYTYSWSNGGGSNSNATGLSAGIYKVIVTDSNGCSVSASTAITQPNILTIVTTGSNATCGISNGDVSSTVSGGTSPYTYVWNDAETTSAISGLSGGTYAVNVTDSNGCSISSSLSITETPAVNVLASTIANITCNGDNIGAASSTVIGGVFPYSYLWSGNGGTNFTAAGLSAGTYTVTATDANGCSSSAETTITEPAAIKIATDSTLDDGGCIGAAWVIVSGGSAPYNYLWDNGKTTSSISGLCKGPYCCTITDANGCIKTACVTIKSTAGVDNITSGAGNITVYPNPSNGQFTIQSSVASGQWSVEVYNVLGEKVYSTFNIQNPTLNINLGSQPNGIYLYRVISGSGNLVGEGKIMIQK